jgi:glucose-1-phosphate cytidylyltransferase|tara:strand:+ start:37 stop:807 length:771 start_codon:yes stop_codon:yes gene_type:complete
MKVVILAGGLGSRISEESILKPKPLIEIGGRPIIWHIMKQYSHYGLNDFVICCGYKGYLIKEYFVNYSLHTTDITVNVRSNKIKVHKKTTEPWNITMVNTGEDSLTGDRIREIKDFVDGDFCLTYGDGLSSVNIKDTIKFHKKNKKIATVVAVKPTGRFGAITINGNLVKKFFEKPKGDGAWVNGGFFVLNKKIFSYLSDKNCIWEKEPLEKIAKNNQLSAYKHEGFWHAMDTLRDKNYLEEIWSSNQVPWKIWDE